MAWGINTGAVQAYQQQQQLANLQASMAPQQQQYASVVPSGSGGGGPAFAGSGGSTSSLNANSILSQYLNGAGGSPTPPTLQLPNMPTAPNYSASGSASITNPYDSQIRALVAQLQGQAAQSDSALSDRANQQIAAQRAVLDRRANQDVQRSLAANGLLPTGGLAARMREQISRPYEEQLAASSADINANMRNQRDATANNLISSLSNIQNASASYALDQQRLQQQAARDQWQMQVDRYNQQAQASQTAYSRALDAYNLQMQQQDRQAALQARQQAAYSTSTGGGGGSMTGSVNGWNGGVNGFLESGRQPEEVYALHQAIGRNTSGQVGDDYFSAGNNRLRAEQEQRAAQVQANRGNGLTSAGSNFNPNDPFGTTLTANSGGGMYSGGGSSGGYGTGGSYGSNAYNTAMGIGSIVGGAGQQLGGTLGSYANSNYSRSMY